MSWRYENAGTADTLIIAGTTLTDLPESKSKTGTAFYQTTRAKCFDLPATSEVWIKFDVFFDGSNRWRAFNGGDNSNPYNVGVTAQTDGALSLVQNSAVIQNTDNVCKTNTLQTVLLHMVSGSSTGVVEAWVDGTKIYRYSGDVNHGEDFADIYLQSDGAGTFFSNVVISDEVPFFYIDADTECQIQNDAWTPAMNLVAYLPFDTSPTQDLCGNTWTAYGDVSLSSEIIKFGTASIHLPSGAYLSANNILDLNADKWTFNCWCLRVSSSGDEGFFGLGEGSSRRGIIVGHDGVYIATSGGGSWQQKNSSLRLPSELNQWKHLEIDKDDTSLKFFENGSLVWSTTINGLNDTGVFLIGGNSSGYTNDLYFAEVMFYEGVALHTEDFTPPTQDDYLALELELTGEGRFSFDADTVRQVVNALGQTQSIHFDGTNGCYGQLPLGVLAGAITFTIEAKLSTTSAKNNSGNYTWATIIGRELGGNWQDDFGLCVNGGKLCFWSEPKTGGSSSTRNTTSVAVINDGAVHKVAVVSSEGAIDLYCDGVLVAHTDNVNAKITDAYNIYLAYNSDSSSYLQMDLYEARFWSIARTQKEIFAPLQGDEQGLEAYYLPEVRTDNILPDLSGNENHATLYGSAHVFPFDFVFDANTVVKIDNNSQLTIWLPFNNYPTEDLCGNWWISTTPNISIHQLSGEEADDNHSVALYLVGESDSAQGQLVLNCQGIYLGGRDFNINFDWWYGGATPFSANCPFGLWDENYSAEGSIYIYNYERFSANWNLTLLRAFGQSTPEFNIQYRSWHSIEVQYLHPEGTLVFYCDGSALATLRVTIPRTLFTHVEIERAAPVEHGSGFISNLKISGGEMASDCANELIYLCVLRNGVVECYPFRAYEFIDYLALAIRYDGRNWYNVLRNPSDERASDFYISHGGTPYALTKE